MFVSAGVELKIHSASDEGIENYQVQYPTSNSKIKNVSICNDNSYIAILRENEKPQILSAKDRQNIRVIHTINILNITALTFKHNTKKNIALGTTTGDVIIYDTKARNVANIHPKITQNIKTLDFTCDDQQLCGLDDDSLFIFPDINSNSQVKKFPQNFECNVLKCHPFIANRAVIGCKNGRVLIWDVQNGVELVNLEVLISPVTGVTMSSCGNYLIASGKDLKICGINFENCTSNFQYNLDQEKPVSSVDLSSDDKFLAVGLKNGILKVYDIKQQMKQIYSSKLHDSPINKIVFENKASQELNSNFSSLVKICSESEIQKENKNNVSKVSSKADHNRTPRTKSPKNDIRDLALEKMKKNILRSIKTEIDSLEQQLQEHCNKFQKFLDNEFETIDATIKKKWDFVNMSNIDHLLDAACPEDEKNSVIN